MLDPKVEFPSGAAAPAVAPEAAHPLSPEPRACPNCGALVVTEFCGHCGQRNTQHLVSLREMVADVVDDQLSVNGTLARTVVPLLLKPGYLTEEYLRGRIVSYVAPLRLLLVSLAVFLLAVEYRVARDRPEIERAVTAAIAKARAREAEAARAGRKVKPIQMANMPVDTLRLPAWLRPPLRPLARKTAELNALPPGQAAVRIIGPVVRLQSRVVVLMVPIVAGVLQLLYFRRRRMYAEHFVFTMHLHALAFLLMGLQVVMPWMWAQTAVLVLLVLYAFLSLKRVYGDGWLGTSWRFALLGCGYILLFAIANPIVTSLMLLNA